MPGITHLWYRFRSGRALRPMPEKFLVAFSFASEDRVFVDRLARATEAALGRGTVFYDKWYEHHIAGDSGRLILEEIYRDRCVLAVPCLSLHYDNKFWPQAEREAMRSRTVNSLKWFSGRADMSVMSIQVGDGPDAKDASPSAVIPDVRHRSLAHTVSVIRTRVAGLEETAPTPALPPRQPTIASNARFVALGIATIVVAVATASTGGLLLAHYF
ncbi:MAG: hypothetical protein AB8G17_14590 [Gammaproteobacteria bacterium]